MAKLVVFGAGGFIGQHLIKALAKYEDNKILAFDRFSQYKTESSNPFGELSNVTIVPGNFFNREDVADVLSDVDFVFHFISSTNPATSSKDPFIDLDTNIRSTIELLELCVEKGVKKVIFPSSGGTVYGDLDSEIINEEDLPQPRSPYGIGKITIEHYLRYFKFTSGLDYIVYRIANPYGPGQNIYGKQGVIPIFMHKFLIDEPLSVFGDGTMVRDYIFIDDLINMIVGTYYKKNQYSEYNIGSGDGISVNQIIEFLEKCTDKEVSKNYLECPPTFIHRSVLNIDRFINEFGLKPTTSFENGITKTWDYVKTLT